MITAVADRVRRWVRGLPRRRRRWVVAAIVGAAYAVVYPVVVLLIALVFRDPVDWGGPAGSFIGGAVGTGLVIWWQSRRMGGLERLGEYERAVKARQLPEDADPAVWRPLLTRELQVQRRTRVLVAAFFAVLGLVVVGLLVVEGVTPLWSVAVAVPAVAALIALLDWLARREQAKVRRLLAGLPGRGVESAVG